LSFHTTPLLLEQRFEEFEQILSINFLNIPSNCFNPSTQSYHLDWLMDRLRSYQHRESLNFSNRSSFALYQTIYFEEFYKLDLITFLQFFFMLEDWSINRFRVPRIIVWCSFRFKIFYTILNDLILLTGQIN
jgi:hypothetical protein